MDGLLLTAVLKLSLRELVVRGVLRAELGDRRRFRRSRLTLLPGRAAATGLPVPLPQLAAALLPQVPREGREATQVVHACVGKRYELLEQLRAEVRETLQAQGLLSEDRSKVLGLVTRRRWVRTPTGEAWAAVPRGLERDRPAAVTGAALPAVGLLLALDDEVARALRSGDDAPVFLETGGDVDGRTLDAVLGDVGAGLDGAVDGGSGGADGGADGGGGAGRRRRAGRPPTGGGCGAPGRPQRRSPAQQACFGTGGAAVAAGTAPPARPCSAGGA